MKKKYIIREITEDGLVKRVESKLDYQLIEGYYDSEEDALNAAYFNRISYFSIIPIYIRE